jgi:tetratricopeptide (TPR) repeat protein
MANFSIGEVVRVISLDQTVSKTGMISFVHENETYDVLYGSNDATKNNEEECEILENRIQRLQSFELDESSSDVEILKNQGNILFGLKDYLKAHKYYSKAISKINNQNNRSTIGCTVLIPQNDSINFLCGMISSCNANNTVDVIIDSIDLDDEQCDVAVEKVMHLPNNFSQKLLTRSVYMNIAKCFYKRNQPGWSIKYASIALAILLHLEFFNATNENEYSKIENDSITKLVAETYYFRGKALLQVNRPKHAEKVFLFSLLFSSISTIFFINSMQYTSFLFYFFLLRKS